LELNKLFTEEKEHQKRGVEEKEKITRKGGKKKKSDGLRERVFQ